MPAAVVTQHAPRGAGAGQALTPQTVPAPSHVPWAWVHCASETMAQPSGLANKGEQHAPVGVGCGQGVWQLEPGPRQRPWAWAQAACVSTSQTIAPAALRKQQPPVGTGCGQAVAEQSVLAPRQVPCSCVHWVSVSCTQTRPTGEVTQHAPRGAGVGQGSLQVVLGPRQRPWA